MISFTHISRFSIVAMLFSIAGMFFWGYANWDGGWGMEACNLTKQYTQQVTNGTCTGVIQGDGLRSVHYYWDSAHPEYGACIVDDPGGWLVDPGDGSSQDTWEPKTWISRECSPTYTCLDNTAVDLTHASFVSIHEQPFENPPVALASYSPIFPLDRDYLRTLVFADNTSIAETADKCEYTCDDGYRFSNGACAGGTSGSTTAITCTAVPTVTISASNGVTSGVQATATYVAPDAATGQSQATITNAGSGYSEVPIVTITGPCTTSFYPKAKAVLSADGKIGSILIDANADAQGNLAAVTVNATTGQVELVGAGYGYATAPTITINSGSCSVAPVATVNNYRITAVTGICTLGTDLTVAAATGRSACTGPLIITVAAPDGLADGARATATATIGTGGVVNFTINNVGSGYTTAPTVTLTGGACTGTLFPTATIADGKVTGITINTSGAGNAAYAVAATDGTTATVWSGGSGYTTAPTVSVTGGTCTTLPTATATIANGSVTGVTLTNAVACTEAPVLTIAPPANACTTGSSVQKCIPLVCTGTAATNAVYCENDTVITGHEDQPHVYRQDQNACTANAKCEWHCPTANPYYCAATNMCVANQDACNGTPTCKTFAPSELQQEYDVPLIQCDATDITKTHFRYKITKTGGSASDTYISPLFTVGTAVKHPTTFSAGAYTVTCLYGTAVNTNATLTDYGMTPDTVCAQTMTAKSSANGCSKLVSYRGSTLSSSLSTGSDELEASFRCGSRSVVSDTTDTKAYRFQIGTNTAAFFGYDRILSELFEGFAIGPVSVQTGQYSITTSADIFCATKIGNGYSTNAGCLKRSCVGASCVNEPETFVVVASADVKCTNSDTVSYEVGCNPASPDYTDCLEYLYKGTGVPQMKVTVNGSETTQQLTCTSTIPPGALGPVKTCKIDLPSVGGPITLFAGDAVGSGAYSFQTTVYAVTKDTGKPVLSYAYYTDYTHAVKLSLDQEAYWQRQPVTAEIICRDMPGTSDGANCACASALSGTQSEVDLWSLGSPSTSTSEGPDLMKYIRRIANNIGALIPLRVKDTAGNISDLSFAPDIGIDSTPPKLTVTSSGSSSVTLTFTDNHPGASGLWKFGSNIPSTIVPAVSKDGTNGIILYRAGTNLANIEFGDGCDPIATSNTNYYTYTQTKSGAAPSTRTYAHTFSGGNTLLAYCIQDNAGNTNRGYYPNTVAGCFSSSNMDTMIPIYTLNPSSPNNYYAPLLSSRIATGTASSIGYSFSANSANANSCFRGILEENINTHLKTQLTPKSTTTLSNWVSDLALVTSNATPNSNGFYYYSFNTATNNTVAITTSPTGTNQKSVVVEGGNILINTNIEYSGGTDKVLVLIARKGTNGGGNIYVNPSVTRIDAILIADGGYLLNGSPSDVKDWNTDASVLGNRLIINGRLYSYNTRGGSLSASGTNNFVLASSGKYFIPTQETPQSASGADVAKYDLERFRLMLPDGNATCTTHIVYQPLTVIPELLKSPTTHTGGGCSF